MRSNFFAAVLLSILTSVAMFGQQTVSPLLSTPKTEVDRQAQAIWKAKLTQCGDEFVAHYPNGQYFALKGAKQVITVTPLSTADKLNGIEVVASAGIATVAMRDFRATVSTFYPTPLGWQKWVDGSLVDRSRPDYFPLRLRKENGKWTVTVDVDQNQLPAPSCAEYTRDTDMVRLKAKQDAQEAEALRQKQAAAADAKQKKEALDKAFAESNKPTTDLASYQFLIARNVIALFVPDQNYAEVKGPTSTGKVTDVSFTAYTDSYQPEPYVFGCIASMEFSDTYVHDTSGKNLGKFPIANFKASSACKSKADFKVLFSDRENEIQFVNAFAPALEKWGQKYGSYYSAYGVNIANLQTVLAKQQLAIGSQQQTQQGAFKDKEYTGGAYKVGGGVSAPSVLYKVEPTYTEEAHTAKLQGTVVLQLVVDEKGRAQNVKVTRSLGLGLDEKAVEAVEKWTFKPGMKEGKPVPVTGQIEISFRLN